MLRLLLDLGKLDNNASILATNESFDPMVCIIKTSSCLSNFCLQVSLYHEKQYKIIQILRQLYSYRLPIKWENCSKIPKIINDS